MEDQDLNRLHGEAPEVPAPNGFALVSAGVMIDDSWKVTGAWLVDQKFRPKSSGPILEIRIRERRVTDT